MIENLKNPFIDEVRERPNEFVLTQDGKSQLIEIARAMDNEITAGTVTSRAAMQILVDKINEVIGDKRGKFCKLSFTGITVSGSTINNNLDGNYSIFKNITAFGVEAVIASAKTRVIDNGTTDDNEYKGIIVPSGVSKIRVRCAGALQYVFGAGNVSAQLVINNVLKPLETYDVGVYGSPSFTQKNIVEDKIYAVKAGDIIGVKYTLSGGSGGTQVGVLNELSSIEIEVIE